MRQAAVLYAVLTAGVIAFHLAMALGAPWGQVTMGGAYPGAFPPPLRLAAVAQALLLGLTIAVVLGRAGVTGWRPPGWAFWGVLGLAALAAVLNLITPSAPERLLWAPVTLVMLAAVLRVARG